MWGPIKIKKSKKSQKKKYFFLGGVSFAELGFENFDFFSKSSFLKSSMQMSDV
jgi:hypothetical protein